MNTSKTHLAVLRALFDLARRDVPATPLQIARETQLPFGAVRRCLDDLDVAGLADRRRVRLTLQGLAVAVANRAAGQLRVVLPRAA